MIEARQLEIVDQLYKSILSPDSWSEVLESVSEDIGSFGINMLVGDKVFGELHNVWFTKNLHEGFTEYMNRGYFKYEAPTAETITKISPQPNLLHVVDIEKEHNKLSENKIDNAFLNEWLFSEYGIKDRFLTPLNYHASHFDSLCISMREGPISQVESSIQRCNFYLPHIANLVNYARPFLLLKSRFNAVLEVLDKYRLGVFLLSDMGEVIETNQAAKDILDQQDGLYLKAGNRIHAQDPDANKELSSAIKTVSQNDLTSKQQMKIVIPRPSQKTGWLLETSTLMHHDLPIGSVIIAIDPENRAVIDTTHFQGLFGLTDAEQNICQLLSEGHSTQEISDIRNTGKETVRGQVKSVLEKTQSSKQSDLVRLAVSINIPVDEQKSG